MEHYNQKPGEPKGKKRAHPRAVRGQWLAVIVPLATLDLTPVIAATVGRRRSVKSFPDQSKPNPLTRGRAAGPVFGTRFKPPER